MRLTFLVAAMIMIVPVAAAVAPKDVPEKKNASDKNNQVFEVLGQIVSVNPEKHTIVLKRGNGDSATEAEYKLSSSAHYWGIDRKPLTDGLNYKGFRQGAQVWCRLEGGETPRTITDLRLFSSPDA